MIPRKLITNFDRLPKHEVVPMAQNCLTHMLGNTYFPDAAPLVENLDDSIKPYQALASIQHPTPQQTAALAEARVPINKGMSAIASMANAKYPGNEKVLLSTGLPLGKENTRHTTLEAPTKFQLVDGPQSGTLCAKCKRPAHAVALKYLYTLAPTLPDNQWFVVVVRDGDALLTACKSGDKVYCKVAAVGGDTDQQPYSEVLSRIVQ